MNMGQMSISSYFSVHIPWEKLIGFFPVPIHVSRSSKLLQATQLWMHQQRVQGACRVGGTNKKGQRWNKIHQLSDAFFLWKNTTWRGPAISQNCRKCCLPRKVKLQLDQILRLLRKMNLIIDPHHIWNVIYNARATKVTFQLHQSASHMKRHLQCAID